MAYDEGLAVRVEEVLFHVVDMEQKKMFGGMAFMVGGHMCVGVVNDDLMARVGPERYEEALGKRHAREMTFTGKPMKGMVFVGAEGISEDSDLENWIDICLRFVRGLPPKVKK